MAEGTEKPDYNLDFSKIVDGKPTAWYLPEVNGYKVSIDTVNSLPVADVSDQTQAKNTVVIEFIGETDSFQPITLSLSTIYNGEQITLSGYIKTENVTEGYAGLWMAIEDSHVGAFDNMQDRGIVGTTEWQKYTITLPMTPKRTEAIRLGGLLVGKGKMWLSNMAISIDGKDISEADIYDGSVSSEYETGFLDLAWKRKSIRSYKPDEIPDDALNKLLTAARSAPSAGNCQPWHFYIIKDKEIKAKLTSLAYDQTFISEAPICIIVCADIPRSFKYYSDRGKNLYCIQDTAAAIQNMLLCATDIGLSTCWIGAFDETGVSELMKFDENMRPVALIPIGYAKDDRSRKFRRPLDEMCTFIGFEKVPKLK